MRKPEFLSEFDARLVKPWANDGTGEWNMLAPLGFYSVVAKKELWTPTGFCTDFASVPKNPITWGLYGGRYIRPAVIHDYGCRYRIFHRREKIDLVFLEAMRVENELELNDMLESGIDDDEIQDRKILLEQRAMHMYLGVAAYTKTGLWKRDFDKPGYEPLG